MGHLEVAGHAGHPTVARGPALPLACGAQANIKHGAMDPSLAWRDGSNGDDVHACRQPTRGSLPPVKRGSGDCVDPVTCGDGARIWQVVAAAVLLWAQWASWMGSAGLIDGLPIFLFFKAIYGGRQRSACVNQDLRRRGNRGGLVAHPRKSFLTA
jgi:hypothetical protein